MLQGLLLGDRLVVMPRFHPRRALELVEQERVTVLIAVPMAYQVMLGLEGLDAHGWDVPADTSSLIVCGTGAAPCPPHLAREIERCFGCAVYIGFGATETGGGIAVSSLADSPRRRTETVGRPLTDLHVKIVDERGRELPPGEVGELICRGESVMLGYYNDPDATAQVIDEGGWYHTGDLGVIDEDGYIRVVGRKRDLIIRGGQNVYPAEIEEYLGAHPQIREAAVVGVPASVGGEHVWAFIILDEGSRCRSTPPGRSRRWAMRMSSTGSTPPRRERERLRLPPVGAVVWRLASSAWNPHPRESPETWNGRKVHGHNRFPMVARREAHADRGC